MKSNKKAFTVVELVIVIAIIAILAAVLIPTFANVLNKANVSKDTQLIRNLNTALTSDRASNNNKPHQTLYDALQTAEAFGYDVGKINASALGNEILWDQENDVFCYLEGTNVVYLPELVDMGKRLSTKSEGRPYHLWKIFNDDDPFIGEGKNPHGFSIYWNGDPIEDTVDLDGIGFDAGTSSVSKISYSTTETRNVIIRTNSVLTDIDIDAPNDTVNHFGEVGKVDITSIDMNCYNEYGNAKYIRIVAGKVVAKANGIINIVFADNTDGSKVAVIKELDGTINIGYTRVEDVDTVNRARENGIELKYAIYLDQTTAIEGDAFANYVKSSADYAVSTAKQVEQAAQNEKQNGPTGTFEVNDPFNTNYASMGDLVIELSKSIRGTDASFTYDPFTKFGDPYSFNNKYENLAESIYDACDESEEDEPKLSFTNTDLIEAEVDDMYDIYIRATKVGSQDITFYIDGEEIGTIHIAVIVVGDDYSSEIEDGNDVFEIDEDSKDVTVDANAHAMVDTNTIENGKTIKLLRSFNGELDFKGYNNKTLILDLNGFTIKSLKIDSVTMTIIDSSEGKKGKVEELFFGCDYGVVNPNYIWDALEDNVEVNSFKGGEYLYLDVWFERPAKLTLINCSIKTLHLQYCGEVEIAGAQIINTDEKNDTLNEGYALSYTGGKYLNITIKSGVVIGYANFDHFGKASISGGYFGSEVPSKYLAAGYTCVKVADGVYQVISNR